MNPLAYLIETIDRFIRTITIKPYGNNLLSPGANNWLYTIRILVIVMATFEGLSWSYVGYLMTKSSNFPWIQSYGPWLVGLSFFSLVWIIDTALVSLDTYERKRLDPEQLLPIDLRSNPDDISIHEDAAKSDEQSKFPAVNNFFQTSAIR